VTGRGDGPADLDRERRIRRELAELRRLIEGNPRLAERTAAMLRGDLEAPGLEEPKMNGAEEQVSIRVPEGTQARAEALVPALNEAPEFKVLRCTKSAILRLAILRGLEALEAEHLPGGRRRG